MIPVLLPFAEFYVQDICDLHGLCEHEITLTHYVYPNLIYFEEFCCECADTKTAKLFSCKTTVKHWRKIYQYGYPNGEN